jgi:16S rRNA G966 N2-methylase RsmD
MVRRNLAELGLSEAGRATRAEVTRWLAGHAEEVGKATLVLLDPPYDDPVLERALALLDSKVAAGTVVVAEHARRQPLPSLDRLRLDRQRRYGDTAVSILTTP